MLGAAFNSKLAFGCNLLASYSRITISDGEDMMRLTKMSAKNYRSLRDTGNVTFEPLQALVGENNAGKSNLLRALQCFLTSGSGGMQVSDFGEPKEPAIIECEFGGLSQEERKRLRPYLLGDRVILRKELRIVQDEARGRETVKAEYHGYMAEPKDANLSITKLEAAAQGSRVKWKEAAEAAGILEFVQDDEGKVTKPSYKKGLDRYLAEHDVEYDEPVVGETQALGIPQNLLSALPEVFLLPGITDYSDEIDRRSSSTVFRRLMGDLADRIMQSDPRYRELEEALSKVRSLLNSENAGQETPRLDALSKVEDSLRDVVRKLMPSVDSIRLGVEIDTSRDIFSKGVSIKIDDGVLTDVLDKGHGMQRSLVFALLQMLIASTRSKDGPVTRPIVLAIEEPELYIHPHSQRLIFHVLKEFAGVRVDGPAQGSDQVIYTTHSPAFVEVWNYERIGVVRKPDTDTGTIVKQAPAGVLDQPEDRKTFMMLTKFGLKHNEAFFARYAIIVEGPEDEIGIIATARKLNRIVDLPDELGISIVVANGKGDIPKFQKVLNAFEIEQGVLLEMDGKADDHKDNASILAVLNGNRLARVPRRVEDILNVGRHFKDQRDAQQFFSNPDNINAEFEEVVKALMPEERPSP